MNTLSITRITHACVLIKFNDLYILTDPWFSEKPGYYRGEPLGITIENLPKLTAVIVSHEHYDHYDMDAFKAYPDKNVLFIVKCGIAEKARKAGFNNIIELDTGEITNIGNIRITATPAKHMVPENTYIIQSEEFTVFFGADTLNIPELQHVARQFSKIDVALVPVNGLKIRPLLNKQVVMNAKEAVDLCSIIKPDIAIPIHYNFTGGKLRDLLLLKYTGTAQEFAELAKQRIPKTKVKILKPGEVLQISEASKQ